MGLAPPRLPPLREARVAKKRRAHAQICGSKGWGLTSEGQRHAKPNLTPS
jgi:hypothetical protein